MKNATLSLVFLVICALLVGAAQAGDHHRDEGTKGAKYVGVIEAMPKNGPEGTWIISGKEVKVYNKTEIKEKHGRAAIGRYVEVKGEQIGETFVSYSLAVEEPGESDSRMAHAKLYGTVEEMPGEGVEGIWRVNGRELLVTGDTRIKEKYGTAAVGSYVEVEGDFSGKTFAVYEIEVKDTMQHNSRTDHSSNFFW